MHLADAFIQSDLQLHSGYTFSSVHVFPGNQTHNLLRLVHEICLYIYVINTHTYTTFFILDAINRLTALIYIYIYIDKNVKLFI